MSENIFEISNIDCAYKKPREAIRVVLSIEKLIIPSGKMVFIIGPSGIGKSTILETLGLMNNTLVVNKDSKFIYYPPNSNNAFNIIEIWKRNKDKELSDFRQNNFSFIFQQTNLMRNFSAYQNVMITGMLQGKSEKACGIKAKEIFQSIGIPELDKDHKATALAGGQQQRLAYARAIIPNFKVIFGDEPTGNLDFENARNLIAQMRTLIQRENKSAIIVSHDLKLSIEYADIIIKIEPVRDEDGEIVKGIIDHSSVFLKVENTEEWSPLDNEWNPINMNPMSCEGFYDYLKENLIQKINI